LRAAGLAEGEALARGAAFPWLLKRWNFHQRADFPLFGVGDGVAGDLGVAEVLGVAEGLGDAEGLGVAEGLGDVAAGDWDGEGLASGLLCHHLSFFTGVAEGVGLAAGAA